MGPKETHLCPLPLHFPTSHPWQSRCLCRVTPLHSPLLGAHNIGVGRTDSSPGGALAYTDGRALQEMQAALTLNLAHMRPSAPHTAPTSPPPPDIPSAVATTAIHGTPLPLPLTVAIASGYVLLWHFGCTATAPITPHPPPHPPHSSPSDQQYPCTSPLPHPPQGRGISPYETRPLPKHPVG